jgi:hypothetical protein
MGYVRFDSPRLQHWPTQLYPPPGYVFPEHESKVWRAANGSVLAPAPLPCARGVPPFVLRFDFDDAPRPLGLPCFRSAAELRADVGWCAYFERVYGEPPTHFPLCISQLSRLYSSLAAQLNLTLPRSSYDVCARDGPAQAVRAWAASKEPSWMVYLLHYRPERTPLPHDTWVEVTHRARSWKSGYERQGLWMGVAGGTGVWFHTGRTIAFREHHEAFQYFRAHWETDLAVNARRAGYDTVQFTRGDSMPHPCCRALGLPPNCFGLELMATRLVGNYACGGPGGDGAFRAGWTAQRRCRCTEDNVGIANDGYPAGYVNCMGTASHCVGAPDGATPLDDARRPSGWRALRARAALPGRRGAHVRRRGKKSRATSTPR